MITRHIDSLKGWERNPREISPEDLARLKQQIQDLGQYKPLLITDDGTVLGGNMRLRAYKELGITDIWVSVVKAETEADKVRFALSDNDHAGHYVEDKLLSLIEDVRLDIDLSEFKVNMGDNSMSLQELIDKEVSQDVTEDEAPEVSSEPAKSELGKVYQLGRHRLMCGDATKIEDVEKLMDGQKADMVFTDPPYNVDYSNADRPKASKTDLGVIKNDKMGDLDFLEFMRKVFQSLDIATKEDSSLYMFFAGTVEFYIAISESNFEYNQLLIWKKPMLLGRSKYQWAHEPCLFGIKGSPYFIDDRTKTTVWDFGGYDKSNNDHPTQKPIVVCTEGIMNSSKTDGLVLDLFGGSGSTLIAAEQTNRTCYMMELDPKYCDVIRKRYAKFIGQEDDWENLTPIVKASDTV